MQHTPQMAVVELVNALGTWVEESLLKRLHKAIFFFCIMADECTDVTTIEELTICCHWVESVYQKNTSWKFYPQRKLMLKVSILH